jgi:hypothetical protein
LSSPGPGWYLHGTETCSPATLTALRASYTRLLSAALVLAQDKSTCLVSQTLFSCFFPGVMTSYVHNSANNPIIVRRLCVSEIFNDSNSQSVARSDRTNCSVHGLALRYHHPVQHCSEWTGHTLVCFAHLHPLLLPGSPDQARVCGVGVGWWCCGSESADLAALRETALLPVCVRLAEKGGGA